MSTTDIKYRNAHLVYNIITGIMVMFIEVYYNFIFFLDFIWIFFHFDHFSLKSYLYLPVVSRGNDYRVFFLFFSLAQMG